MHARSRLRTSLSLIRGLRGVVLGAALVANAACTSVPLSRSASATGPCLEQFVELDARVARAGVGDAESARIAGFPYLRINRLLESLGEQALLSSAASATWLEHLAALDADARAVELSALEGDPARRASATKALAECRSELRNALVRNQNELAHLQRTAKVPPAYRRWQRTLGLYPLAAYFARRGVARLQATEMPVARDLRTIPPATTTYALPSSSLSLAAAAQLVANAPRDALGIPSFDASTLNELTLRHAPVWLVSGADAADRIGTITRETQLVDLDRCKPSVYTYVSYTRFENDVLLQLNYVVWFAARPKTGALDLLGGPLDGVTWRVTLDRDGLPLAYDSMHNCGCYQLWLPTARLTRRLQADDETEPPWVPFSLSVESRPAVLLAARTHYVVAAGPAPETEATLTARDYDELRMLPVGAGKTRSMFDADGLVPESHRLERWILWPLGVPSAGTMRQRGLHATAFIGTRHFDDARALERYFQRAAPALPGTDRH